MRAFRTAVVVLAGLVVVGCGGRNAPAATPRPPAHRAPSAAPPRRPAAAAPRTTPAPPGRVIRLDGARGEPQTSHVASDGSGGAFAATELRAGSGGYSCDDHDSYAVRLVRVERSPDRAGFRRSYPGHLAAGPVALPGGRAAILLDVPGASSVDCEGGGSTLTLVTLDAHGRVLARRALARDASIWSAALVADGRGRPRAAWIDVAQESRFALRLAAPEPGGPSRTLEVRDGVDPQDPGVSALAFAAEPGARVLLAWASAGSVRAADVSAAGAPGRARRLGATKVEVDLGVAANAAGRAVVAWGSVDGGEERNSPYVVRAALRRAGGARFAPAETLDAGGAIIEPVNPVLTRVDRTGRVAVAWVNATHDEADTTLRTATATTTGTAFTLRRLQPVDRLADLRLRRDGRLLVATGDHGRAAVGIVPGPGRTRALPAGSARLLGDGLDAPAVVVGGDDSHATLALSRP